MTDPTCWRCESAPATRHSVFCAACWQDVKRAALANDEAESRARLIERGHQITGGNE